MSTSTIPGPLAFNVIVRSLADSPGWAFIHMMPRPNVESPDPAKKAFAVLSKFGGPAFTPDGKEFNRENAIYILEESIRSLKEGA